VYRISATLKCPQCVGESVAQSDAAISREIRQQIAELIPKGYSDDQIRDRIAANYDAEIRTTPTRSGVTGLVWMLPVVVGVLALAGLVVVFRKWSRAERLHASDEDRELVASAIGDGHAG
jgi:cytochrome c-type biogenesis protein CcmH